MRIAVAPLAVAAWLAVAPFASSAEPPGSPAAREALDLCAAGDRAPREERAAIYARGLALAEQAIAADDRDAKAHLAAFCNRGRQMELAGPSVMSVVNLRRLRQSVDRALELAPDYEDALAGKGALLLDTPRLLGGDPAEGERLLHRALALDPHDTGVRLRLARALAARGARTEARTEAQRVATEGDDGEKKEARELLARLEK